MNSAATPLRRKRMAAIVAVPAVLAVMYPIFQLRDRMFGGALEGYLASRQRGHGVGAGSWPE